MYINKVVFLEEYEVEKLQEIYPNLIAETDYGTTELIGGFIQDARNDWEEFSAWLGTDVTYEQFKEEVSNIIGEELYRYLLEGKVDFCLIV